MERSKEQPQSNNAETQENLGDEEIVKRLAGLRNKYIKPANHNFQKNLYKRLANVHSTQRQKLEEQIIANSLEDSLGETRYAPASPGFFTLLFKNYRLPTFAFMTLAVLFVCTFTGLAGYTTVSNDFLGQNANLNETVSMINVESQPAGADVYLNGELIGKTPLQKNVEPGKYHLKLVAENYQESEREIEVVSNQESNFAISLESVLKDFYADFASSEFSDFGVDFDYPVDAEIQKNNISRKTDLDYSYNLATFANENTIAVSKTEVGFTTEFTDPENYKKLTNVELDSIRFKLSNNAKLTEPSLSLWTNAKSSGSFQEKYDLFEATDRQNFNKALADFIKTEESDFSFKLILKLDESEYFINDKITPRSLYMASTVTYKSGAKNVANESQLVQPLLDLAFSQLSLSYSQENDFGSSTFVSDFPSNIAEQSNPSLLLEGPDSILDGFDLKSSSRSLKVFLITDKYNRPILVDSNANSLNVLTASQDKSEIKIFDYKNAEISVDDNFILLPYISNSSRETNYELYSIKNRSRSNFKFAKSPQFVTFSADSRSIVTAGGENNLEISKYDIASISSNDFANAEAINITESKVRRILNVLNIDNDSDRVVVVTENIDKKIGVFRLNVKTKQLEALGTSTLDLSQGRVKEPLIEILKKKPALTFSNIAYWPNAFLSVTEDKVLISTHDAALENAVDASESSQSLQTQIRQR